MVDDPFTGRRVVAFALETTGLDVRKDRVVQYALIGSDVDGSTITVESLVNPQQQIPRESSAVHGITDSDVRSAGTFAEHADQLSEILDGAIVIGHNIERYDWRLLTAEYTRIGRLPPKPTVMIDTLRLAKRLRIPGRHDLGTLCRGADITLNNAHNAAADAGATLMLLWRWMSRHPREFRRSPEELQTWISAGNTSQNSLGPSLDDLEPMPGSGGRLRIDGDRVILAFGKHKARDLLVVASEEPGYIRWLCSPAGPLNQDAIDAVMNLL